MNIDASTQQEITGEASTSGSSSTTPASKLPERPSSSAAMQRPVALASFYPFARDLIRPSERQTDAGAQTRRGLVPGERQGVKPVPGSAAHAATEPRKKSISERFKSAVSTRQISVAAVLPGTGRTVNRPLRPALPCEDAIQAGPRANDDLTAEARQLSKLAESLVSSLGQPEAALWERPAQSTARRWVTKVLPWLKPAPLTEIASLAGPHSHSAAAKQSTAFRSERQGREDIAMEAEKLLDEVKQLRKNLNHAVEKFESARAEHHHWRTVSSDSPQAHDADLNRKKAQAEAQTASDSLHAALTRPDLVGLMSLNHLAEQDERSLAFVRKRITELQARAHVIRSSAYDRRDVIEIELQARKAQREALPQLELNFTAAEKAEADAKNDLALLNARLAKARSQAPGPSTGQADSPLIKKLLGRIGLTQAILEGAQNAKSRCEGSIAEIGTEFAQLNDQIATLTHQQTTADAQIEEAERSLTLLNGAAKMTPKAPSSKAPLDAPSDVRADTEGINAPLNDPVDAKAIKELEEHVVTNLEQVPHAFGPRSHPELEAALRVLASDLSQTSTPNQLPLAMALEVVTNALADVTKGDPERAVSVLAKIKSSSIMHWVELAQQATDNPTRSVPGRLDAMALCRKLAT